MSVDFFQKTIKSLIETKNESLLEKAMKRGCTCTPHDFIDCWYCHNVKTNEKAERLLLGLCEMCNSHIPQKGLTFCSVNCEKAKFGET